MHDVIVFVFTDPASDALTADDHRMRFAHPLQQVFDLLDRGIVEIVQNSLILFSKY
jgi:hypothetical protein